MVSALWSNADAGRVFARTYEITRLIRAGGMGAVYEVVHRPTRRRRALKVLLPEAVGDPEMLGRFELEARITAGIACEHLVETIDAGFDDETGTAYLVMELLDGEDLGATLKARRFSVTETLDVLHQLATALEHTHAAGIVHRDLKPENVFLVPRPERTPLVKILDFGIAKLVAQSTQSMKTTRSVGTPLYMAPEQVRGDGGIDERADVYSLAHLAFALLVGHAYWEKEAHASQSVYPLLLRITSGSAEQATKRARGWGIELLSPFDPWFAKATASDRADRYRSATEMVDALARALDPSAPRLRSRRPKLVWAVAMIALAASAWGAVAMAGHHREQVTAPIARASAPAVHVELASPSFAAPLETVPTAQPASPAPSKRTASAARPIPTARPSAAPSSAPYDPSDTR